MREHDRFYLFALAVLVACALAVIGVMLAVSLLEADHDLPDPPTETVETDTQAKADDPATWEVPVVVETDPDSPFSLSCEVAKPEPPHTGPQFVDEVDTYLAYIDLPNGSYDHLVDSGRRLDAIDRGVPAIVYPMSDEYRKAAYIAYYALCFDTFLAYYAPGSLWVGRGLEVARKCEEAGIRWEMAAATLYAESDWGRQRSGLIWGNASTLDGWIAWCLREMADPNDVDCFVNEFHMPANREIYRFNFGNVVERARAWRP